MISTRLRIILVLQVAWELFLYDLLRTTFGFAAVHQRASRPARIRETAPPEIEELVLSVVSVVSAFYWKPVLCLQRSMVASRVLKKHGVNAEVVIGCRNAPFAGHAWVEVAGRALQDARGYQQKMLVLERF